MNALKRLWRSGLANIEDIKNALAQPGDNDQAINARFDRWLADQGA